MPKRSDAFQTLVAQIQHHVADASEVTVEESKMLPHAVTGELREVDIVVQGTINGIEVVVSFECCRLKRAAGSEWVEQMIGKHENLPTHRLILVSQSGLTEPAAIAVGVRKDVEAVTFEEASTVDWGKYAKRLTELRFGAFQSTPIGLKIRWDDEAQPANPKLPEDTVFRRISDGREVGAFELALAYTKDKRVKQSVTDQYYKGGLAEDFKVQSENKTFTASGTIDVTFNWKGHEIEWEAVLPEGAFSVQSISLKIRIDIKDSTFELDYHSFMGKNVAHGLVKDPFADPNRAESGDLSVAITQEPNQIPIASVSYIEHPRDGKKTFIFEPEDTNVDPD